MEVQELREIVDLNFRELDKRLAVCFKGIDDRGTLTDAAIAGIAASVQTHDHWLWLLRGMGVIIVILLGWLGVKVRF